MTVVPWDRGAKLKRRPLSGLATSCLSALVLALGGCSSEAQDQQAEIDERLREARSKLDESHQQVRSGLYRAILDQFNAECRAEGGDRNCLDSKVAPCAVFDTRCVVDTFSDYPGIDWVP